MQDLDCSRQLKLLLEITHSNHHYIVTLHCVQSAFATHQLFVNLGCPKAKPSHGKSVGQMEPYHEDILKHDSLRGGVENKKNTVATLLHNGMGPPHLKG